MLSTLIHLRSLWPDLLVMAGAFVVLALDIPFRAQKDKKILSLFSVGVFLAALLILALDWSRPFGQPALGVLADNAIARMAKLALILVGLLTLLITRSSATRLGLIYGEYYALLLFAVSGMMLFSACLNLIAAFVALETFSLAFYILAGFNRRSRENREAALKYFIIGALAAAFFLFGIALVYGATGAVGYEAMVAAYPSMTMHSAQGTLLLAGLALLMVGLGFKVGLAPFHFWAPDTYEGAPTPISAFLSAGAKVAGFAAMAQLFSITPVKFPSFVQLVSFLAVATMVLANLGALRQEGLKRLMAYSSVAHSGYALVALAGGAREGLSAVMLYVLVYAIMNFGTFALILAAEESNPAVKEGRPLKLSDLEGLGFERPLFGLCLAVLMFSMAGIPPTAGFVAKLGVFKAALSAGQTKLVVLAVLNSVISAAFYLRVLVTLYMKPKNAEASAPSLGSLMGIGAGICVLVMLIWGVLPGTLFKLAGL